VTFTFNFPFGDTKRYAEIKLQSYSPSYRGKTHNSYVFPEIGLGKITFW
jgi:hypothetical protein